MKKIVKYLSLLLLLTVVLVSCTEEEIRYLDPMIGGICDRADDQVKAANSGSWSSALLGFREQRLKLLVVKDLIETDGYTGDNYTLADEDMSLQRVNSSLESVAFKIDSVWNEEVQNVFAGINENSAGIVNFGTKQYNETELDVADAYAWILADTKTDEGGYTSNDLAVIKSDIDVLVGLAALNDQEVTDFVNELKAKYAEMLQQYADLETEVNSSPYFSKAQKEIYAALDQRLIDLGTTIEEELSLSTKDQQDLVDRDLSALVYFVDNNYTSPAQAPLVFGEISSITELRWLSEQATGEQLNNTWVLTTDIDAAETVRWNPNDPDGRFGFRPIITPTSINFDGQFHVISGLHMTKIGGAGEEERSGMFTKIVNGSIMNLGLIYTTVDATNGGNGNQGGTLVGMITGSGSITKCFTHGQLIKAGSQTGGFIGRPQVMTGEISDCFSVVATTQPVNAATSSFIGLPVANVNLYNCYNLGAADTNVRAIFGHGAGIVLNASGIYYDSETVGTTVIEHHTEPYSPSTPTKLSDDGVVTDLPTADWNDLSNFPGFSVDTWEIRTVPVIDGNPRPYLKGFNYDAIADFIVPEQ